MTQEVDGAEALSSSEQPQQKSHGEMEDPPKVGPLFVSILIVATCSIIYELIIGTLSSYLLGNSVYQFSLIIGLYLFGMGIGSFFSKFFTTDLLAKFFWVEIAVGLVGGTCSALLFGVFTFSPYFQITIWFITLLIGTLVGLEIPLLTRYVQEYSSLKDALANVLGWDYIGALFGSVGFPLLLLPTFGVLNSAAIVGLVNLSVAIFGVLFYWKRIKSRVPLLVVGIASVIGLVTLFSFGGAYERFLDKKLFTDPVVYRAQTPYQKLTLTAWRKDVRLFINGNIQFSSTDEYRYHEMLVRPAMTAAKDPRSVLILGGGDGLVVTQLQKYPSVEAITLVDLDPEMTRIAAEHPTIKRLNNHAFDDPRLKVINADAMAYLKDTPKRFDVIIVDLPDPNNESLAKLYSVAFYRMAAQRLTDNGAFVTQSSSVYYSPNAFWSIHKTIERAFCENGCSDTNVIAYHAWVPSFGDWGFNLASKAPIDVDKLPIPNDGRFLNPETFIASLHFSPDIAERDVETNRLIEPVLLDYYLRDWKQFHP